MLPIIIMGSIVMFYILVFIISEVGDKHVKGLWKFVKYEFIVLIAINIFRWISISLKISIYLNLFLFLPSLFIILFIITWIIWNNYKNTSLRYEESPLFKVCSDGNGRYTPKSGIVGCLSMYSVLLPILTFINIFIL